MKKRMSAMLCSFLLAAELTLLLDFVSVWLERALSVPKFGALFVGLFLAIWLIPAVTPKGRKIGICVLTAAAALLGAMALCWYTVSCRVTYQAPDTGKAQLYGGKKVMLLVPHQDDEINVLGGVIEEYRKYGSQVYLVYSTNGDYYGQASTRMGEALTAARRMGVSEEQVIFLGYGDQWSPDGPHLYNAQPGEVATSFWGKTQTYGTEQHDVYRPGRDYTVDHFLEDIRDVILEHCPDVLYCVDYDYNIDHRALSLAFEKVMGQILKEEPDYRPMVFKGYAYDTAWEAVKDFYGENLLSTRNPFEPPYEEKPAVYRWEDRVRLPVHGENLSRSMVSAGAWEILGSHASQGAKLYGEAIFNSDKVFWYRSTESLCHQAVVETSSSNASLLNDFMLLEDHDLRGSKDQPWDGVWIPEDSDKEAAVTFSQPQDVETVVLYDHPDQSSNVLEAVIRFDGGAEFRTGPLDPGGAATRISVSQKNVSGFTVALTRWEGEAGLTELEAYGDSGIREASYVKLMDEAGNFAYDYWIHPRGEQLFQLYVSGAAPAGEGRYTLTCSGDSCRASWEGGRIRIQCPQGKACVVTVTSADGQLSDSIYVQNPGPLVRKITMFWLRAEEAVMEACAEKRLHERLFLCRLWQKMPGILDRVLP